METHVRTPFEVFNTPQTLTVPMYQRLYVWQREPQWQPLWEDVQRLAEAALRREAPLHFLGAVVIQQADKNWGESLDKWSLVDGQQRLTTLQLLMDAVAGELMLLAAQSPDVAKSLERLASQLEECTHNDDKYLREGQSALKLGHENRDAQAFRAVMDAKPGTLPYEGQVDAPLIAQAHAYFARMAREWLGADGAASTDRGEALTQALRQGLQLVVISLKSHEDSQAIFETLNARGTPLTATDLIKNLVFQRLDAEGADLAGATAIWGRFETKRWETEERVGTTSYPRSALFLRSWLVAELGEEVPQRQLFPRFKRFMAESTRTAAEIVRELDACARAYEAVLEESALEVGDISVPAMFLYRTQASKQQTADPVLIWLIDPKRHIPDDVRDAALAVVESWLVRRALLRLGTSNLAPVVAALTGRLNASGPTAAADAISSHLRGLDQPTTYWPGDEEIRRELTELPVYQRYARPRLRMLLEAAEDHLRGFTENGPSRTGQRVPRDGRPIEHLLPRKWQEHWPLGSAANSEAVRADHVHRLGNLTLITQGLNSSISNGPWSGERGKHAALTKHDVYLLNREIREMGSEHWDEELIDARTTHLVDALLATWPVPDGHEGALRDRDLNDGREAVTVQKLVARGLLDVGAELVPAYTRAKGKVAVVLASGNLLLDDREFDSPSGAARFAAGTRAEGGWKFWRTADGRLLDALRHDYVRELASGTELGATG